ncbi:hypothetical protein [Empedobacter tilapiae]|uniref:Uncharacterized protein n=1 Tax=Empedobacter tilapiae TaxID=2491114 RepID=A0A4Z1B9P0_9FLAO|nr:hypothetical protein [Empedobacter tilapiae]TGN27148.1 hypothetical protein E4J94_07990 [Empedobacter tilapiae]
MKLLATKILIFLYLTTSTQFSQLYKLPIFFSHFIEHLQKDDSMGGIVDFVILHYNGHEKDADWETDQKLPFIKIEVAHIDQSYLPIVVFTIPQIIKEVHHELVTSFDENFIYFHYSDSIWQPPRQA